MEIAPHWISVGIAIGTVIIVPTLVWSLRKIAQAWHDHRVKVLREVFVPREDVQRQYSELATTQARQHGENQYALEQLRLEGKEREGRLVGMMDTARKDNRDAVTALSSSIGDVHRRVDSILAILGNRRRPD